MKLITTQEELVEAIKQIEIEKNTFEGKFRRGFIDKDIRNKVINRFKVGDVIDSVIVWEKLDGVGDYAKYFNAIWEKVPHITLDKELIEGKYLIVWKK